MKHGDFGGVELEIAKMSTQESENKTIGGWQTEISFERFINGTSFLASISIHINLYICSVDFDVICQDASIVPMYSKGYDREFSRMGSQPGPIANKPCPWKGRVGEQKGNLLVAPYCSYKLVRKGRVEDPNFQGFQLHKQNISIDQV